MAIQKSEIQSAVATAIICILILLILFFCGMTAHRNEMDEGVMVSLGYFDDGWGEQKSSEVPLSSSSPLPTAAAPQPQVYEEDLITQDDPSVAIEAERKRKQQEEEARIRAEQEERARREAQIKAEQEAKQKQIGALAGSAFQNKGKGQGSGTGDTQQGTPIGFGTQGGNSWSLSGRNILGRLAQPSYKGNEEGTIVVQIRVDASGNVTSASIATGTTITDETMRKASIDAARKNRFTTDNGVAIGTITYKFSLN